MSDDAPRFFVARNIGSWNVMDSKPPPSLVYDGLDRVKAEVIAAILNDDFKKAREFLDVCLP